MAKNKSRSASRPGGGQTGSSRQVIREQRLRKQRQQRISVIVGITVVALIVAAIFILPSIYEATRPVGEIVQVTPMVRPLVDGLALGEADAPVTVEVFEDFQCPRCAEFANQVEPQIVENYVANGQVRLIFRHFPVLDDLSGSRESDQAANATMCAMEQGKFWEYHDIVYANWNGENQGAYRDARLIAFAEAAGLDMGQFNDCFEENRYRAEIEADLNLGRSMGVQGTPSVFVNGEAITPGFVPSYQTIQEAIERYLSQ